MSKIRYEYMDMPKTTEQAVSFMQNQLMPLIDEYWDKRGKDIYEKPLRFNVMSFVQMWMLGGCVLVMAYDGDKPVGFLLGIRFTPILFKAAVVQTEVWYGVTDEVERGLFEYLSTITKFMDVEEIWVMSDVGSEAHMNWNKRATFTVDQYVRK